MTHAAILQHRAALLREMFAATGAERVILRTRIALAWRYLRRAARAERGGLPTPELRARLNRTIPGMPAPPVTAWGAPPLTAGGRADAEEPFPLSRVRRLPAAPAAPRFDALDWLRTISLKRPAR